MTKPNKHYWRIGFVISLLIVIATICEHANTESILRTANGILLGLIRSSIYIGLFAAWRFSVRQRIVPKNTRRYLSAVAFFLILWMVIRTVKYYFVVDPNINRILWYCYYIPMLFVPLISIFVSASIGKPENSCMSKSSARWHSRSSDTLCPLMQTAARGRWTKSPMFTPIIRFLHATLLHLRERCSTDGLLAVRAASGTPKAARCMNLPELDNPTYPPYGRLYCYYDPVYGFGDSADGDCSPIDSGTVLKVGDQYPFAIKFYPVDGYDYSELEKENIRLVTPYCTCTATRFRPGFSENSYWLTFDLPAILTYTVSFDANGGSGTMADVTGISGEYTLPENGFTAPDGKQFKAWSVDGSEKAAGDKITVTADTTVTAVWETIPAGHTCDIKPVQKVEPSCTEGGKEAYYKCEGCGKFYKDALGTKEITDLASWGNLPKLGHTESDWKSDKDNHWKECTVDGCGVIIEDSKAAHADANNDGKCDVCEYNVGIPTTPGGDKPDDNPQTGDTGMMGLWIALLFVSGFGVVTTAVYGKKRKSVK